jgi:5-methylcytosine-specific restriction endonuclease McrA
VLNAVPARSNTISLAEKQLRTLSDSDLLFHVQLAVRGERAMTIKVLHHLNEIQRRKLYLELGYRSLFDYCIRRLKYSASAAGRRIQAARCIRRYPEVLELLRERELSLSTIALIEPILTDSNKATILERVRGKSHRAVERVASEYRAPVAYRDRVRPVRVAAPPSVNIDGALFERELKRFAPGAGTSGEASTPGDDLTPGAGNDWVEQKLLVQFLASDELMAKFEEAKALLSHRSGDGSFAEVLAIILEEFLERHSPTARQARREVRKSRKTEARRTSAAADPTPDVHSRRRECKAGNHPSRHIPVEVRDEVFVRDGGACTFAARDGTRCGSTRSLQIDHIRPYAAGGTHDPSNLRLLCAAHNRLAAERTLGKDSIKRFWRKE